MIPAAILATHLHVPLYGIRDGQLVAMDAGDRMNNTSERQGRTLLVEDSVGIGHRVRKLASTLPIDQWCKLAIYVLPRSKHLVDIYAKEVPAPHLFEWNFFNGVFMRSAALDMDGIICRDVTGEPQYVPRNVPCAAIITARPESARAATVAWLNRYGARYDRLIMWPGQTADRNLYSQADWKVEMMRDVSADIYVESCPYLSGEMRKRGMRVLCPQEGILR